MYVHMDVKYASNKLENAYITKWIKQIKEKKRKKEKQVQYTPPRTMSINANREA